MARNYGWQRDAADERDYRFAAPTWKLPKHVDLRDKMSAVKNQGELGSCTGHAIAGALEYLYPSRPNFSRLFIYYNERAVEGTINEDAGAQIRTGVKSVAKVGACKETLCPYDPEKFTKKPTVKAYADAAKNVISSYRRVTSLQALKYALSKGSPVVFGFQVFAGFESEETAETGMLAMPESHEEPLGGHAVLAVGYDERKGLVIVRNSWGRQWGDKGYFYMPYDYVADKNLSDDFWTLSK
jgi:C1A family cysteine protease